jgi:hypothetical protein
MLQGGWSGVTQSELLSVFVKQVESLLGSEPFLQTLGGERLLMTVVRFNWEFQVDRTESLTRKQIDANREVISVTGKTDISL